MDSRRDWTVEHYRVWTAWQEQVRKAVRRPWLLRALLDAETRSRFFTLYAHLRALPRQTRRALQRRLAQSLAGLALVLALGQGHALAATINVTGGCTLVDAITAANGNVAVGGCTAGSGADTLTLNAGSVHTLTTVDNSTHGATGLPVVNTTITIAGNGSTIRRAAVPLFRLLAVTAPGNLTLQDLTLTGGVASGAGGGVLSSYGTLAIINSTITGNSATAGGGVHNRASLLTITNSTISGNRASSSGGGVSNGRFGDTHIINSRITGNSTVPVSGGSHGGGVSNSSLPVGTIGNLVITNSTITGNTAFSVVGSGATSFGGGVSNYDALTITNSTISGNAARNGGGVGSYGGLAISSSTISGNTATFSGTMSNSGFGGGVDSRGGLTITDSTITRNSAFTAVGGVRSIATLTLHRTLVSGNTAPAGQAGREVRRDPGFSIPGTVTVNDFNVFGVSNDAGVAGFAPGVTDIVPAVALSSILNPTLAMNGGPTRTHALVAGSPAIDTVTNGSCPPPTIDQRGFVRPFDGDGIGGAQCDSGAFEFAGPPAPGCGNGIVEGSEQCDDGNLMENDCCSSTCEAEDLGTMICGSGTCPTTVPQCIDGVPQSCTPVTPGTDTCRGDISIPVRWCAIDGTPSEMDPALVGEPPPRTVKDVMWRRHERCTDNISMPQARITFRSGATFAVPAFPVLADVNLSPGSQPGDVLDPSVDGGAEFRATINLCRAEWQTLDPKITGLTAVHMRRFVDAVGVPTGVLGLGGQSLVSNGPSQLVAGRVMVIDNAFLLPGSPLQSLGPDPVEKLLCHEFGHALTLVHGNGVDDDFDGVIDGPPAELGETLDGPNLMQYRFFPPDGTTITTGQANRIRAQAVLHIPDLMVNPVPVPRGNTAADVLGDAAEADISEFGVATAPAKGLTYFLVDLNGLLSDSFLASGFEVLFLADTDNNPTTGGNPSSLPGVPSANGIELVARVQVSAGVAPGSATASATVFRFDSGSGQFVVVTAPGIAAAVRTELLSVDTFDLGALIEETMAGSHAVQVRIPSALINPPLGTQLRFAVFTRTAMADPIDDAVATLTFVLPTFPSCQVTAGAFPVGIAFLGKSAVIEANGLLPNTPVRAFLGDDLILTGMTDNAGHVVLPVTLPADPAAAGRRLITVGHPDSPLTADCKLKIPQCDLDGDGDIDRNDANIILAVRNTPAAGFTDRLDIDDDEVRTVNDARICTTQCTKPRCAP